MTNVEDILLSMKLHIPKIITQFVLSNNFENSPQKVELKIVNE